MSKKKTKITSGINPTKSTVSKTTTAVKITNDVLSKDTSSESELLFGRANYMYILGGIGLMALGFLLMVGGKMPSPDVWDESIIYSTRRTLIAPILILAGLVVQIFAIFKK
ncbi:MAG: DUF3098 domain-containing protein [Saprospiraceae bacterium]